MIDLREYQSRGVDMTREELKRFNSVCLVIPPGGGKTRIAAAICERVVMNEKQALFIPPRRALVTQSHAAFEALGLRSGIYMAGMEFDPRHKIDIASIDTITSRIEKEYSQGRELLKTASVIFFDEGHVYASKERAALINDIRTGVYGPKKKIILLTGTPCTGSGGGLGNICEKLIVPVTMRELIDQGYLLQPRYFSAPMPDLSHVKKSGDDLNQKQLGEAYDKPKIVGSVVENWLRIAPGTSTVVFAPTRANATHLAEQFEAVGVKTAYVDALTDNDERDEIFEKIQQGEIQVVCNVLVIGMGVDLPRLETVVFATKTKSVTRWVQGVCRPDRPWGDQKFYTVIDHGGMYDDPNLGAVEDIADWDLAPKQKVQDRIEKRKKENKELKEIKCPKCPAIFKAAHRCPRCGYQLKQKSEPLDYYEADLQEMKPIHDKFTKDEKQKFYSELLTICDRNKYNSGWIANTYRKRFNVWPSGMKDVAIEPSRSTKQYVGILLRKYYENKRRVA